MSAVGRRTGKDAWYDDQDTAPEALPLPTAPAGRASRPDPYAGTRAAVDRALAADRTDLARSLLRLATAR